MAKPKIDCGINVNTRCPIIYPKHYPAPRLVDLAVRVEKLGYDTVFVGDNYFSKPRLESTTTLAAIASRTKRVKLATSALISPLRNTVWLALQWATIDQLSAGRTVLVACVGGGSAEAGGPEFTREFDVAGVPYRQRGAILEEQIQVLRKLWAEPKVTFHGAFHTLEDVPFGVKPKRGGRLPIWIANNPQIFPLNAGVVDRMLRRVAHLADGWQTCLATPDEYRSLLGRIREFAREAGRIPNAIVPSYQVLMNVNRDRAKARKEALEFTNKYYVTKYQAIEESMWERDPFGTPDECIKKLRGIIEAGCRSFSFRFASPDQFEQVERFTKSVLPALKD
jgi:alkanesulfonate monooxygenase SsuD/methylene tetrahydromethanopterin reductase-like flavin-dependent oxidoreductase (luciferase family)